MALPDEPFGDVTSTSGVHTACGQAPTSWRDVKGGVAHAERAEHAALQAFAEGAAVYAREEAAEYLGRVAVDEARAGVVEQRHPCEVGEPLIGTNGRVVAHTNGASEGEIEVAGPFVAAGYFGGGGEAFTADGWLRTGDLGRTDAHGYLRIADRLKDIIKSGGEWISSLELEKAITSHPAVAEAAVVGRPDDKWGERPVAAVVVRNGRTVTAEGIIEHLRPLVAKWWLPDEIVFLETLPKTGTGKVSKVTLRGHLGIAPPPVRQQ